MFGRFLFFCTYFQYLYLRGFSTAVPLGTILGAFGAHFRPPKKTLFWKLFCIVLKNCFSEICVLRPQIWKLFCKIVLQNCFKQFSKKSEKMFCWINVFSRKSEKMFFHQKMIISKKLKNTFLPNNACTWGVLTSLLNNDRGIITPVKSCKPGYSVAVAGLRWLSRNSAVPKT